VFADRRLDLSACHWCRYSEASIRERCHDCPKVRFHGAGTIKRAKRIVEGDVCEFGSIHYERPLRSHARRAAVVATGWLSVGK